MSILFFVGCDKTGKSTLFKAVLSKTNKHICVDRFTPCQYIYGKHHGRNDTPSLEKLREIEEIQRHAGGGFVWVTADPEVIKSRFKQHKEKDIEIKDIEKILNEYENYIYNSPLPFIRIDTTSMSIEEAAEYIIDFGNKIDKQVI